jgi:hypothetical protein
MEERAGERRSLSRLKLKPPLSSILSPLLRRGERKKKRTHKFFVANARSFIIVVQISPEKVFRRLGDPSPFRNSF